jgi:hypothetical protein
MGPEGAACVDAAGLPERLDLRQELMAEIEGSTLDPS